jgi:hypothetical protein
MESHIGGFVVFGEHVYGPDKRQPEVRRDQDGQGRVAERLA